jgi:hypothetical protein
VATYHDAAGAYGTGRRRGPIQFYPLFLCQALLYKTRYPMTSQNAFSICADAGRVLEWSCLPVWWELMSSHTLSMACTKRALSTFIPLSPCCSVLHLIHHSPTTLRASCMDTGEIRSANHLGPLEGHTRSVVAVHHAVHTIGTSARGSRLALHPTSVCRTLTSIHYHAANPTFKTSSTR